MFKTYTVMYCMYMVDVTNRLVIWVQDGCKHYKKNKVSLSFYDLVTQFLNSDCPLSTK